MFREYLVSVTSVHAQIPHGEGEWLWSWSSYRSGPSYSCWSVFYAGERIESRDVMWNLCDEW